MPKTTLGKWSLGLMIALPLLVILGAPLANSLYKDVPAGNTIFEDLTGRPILSLTMLAAMVSGILAFITGLIAIWKKQERSVLTYISTIIGALFLLFLIGEFLFPH